MNKNPIVIGAIAGVSSACALVGGYILLGGHNTCDATCQKKAEIRAAIDYATFELDRNQAAFCKEYGSRMKQEDWERADCDRVLKLK